MQDQLQPTVATGHSRKFPTHIHGAFNFADEVGFLQFCF